LARDDAPPLGGGVLLPDRAGIRARGGSRALIGAGHARRRESWSRAQLDEDLAGILGRRAVAANDWERRSRDCAMTRATSLLHVKRTRAKGRTYYYFRTGQRGRDGKEILSRLPDLKDPGFGASYAAHLGARTKRDQVALASAELTVPQLCDLYERSPHFRGLSAGRSGCTAFPCATSAKCSLRPLRGCWSARTS
jgi:hypothetical protein